MRKRIILLIAVISAVIASVMGISAAVSAASDNKDNTDIAVQPAKELSLSELIALKIEEEDYPDKIVVGDYEYLRFDRRKEPTDPAEIYKLNYNGRIITDVNESIGNLEKYDIEYMTTKLNGFIIGFNASKFYDGGGNAYLSVRDPYNLLSVCPDVVMREREDGTKYLVTNAKDGIRLFLLLDEVREKQVGEIWCKGYPILYKNVLSLADFSEIKVGDTLSDVEKIDDICSVYRYAWREHKLPSSSFEVCAKGYENRAMGWVQTPFCTVHYLTDGLLFIEYGKTEGGEPIVSGIKYSPDYLVEGLPKEGTVNYKLNPLDLIYD